MFYWFYIFMYIIKIIFKINDLREKNQLKIEK